MSILHFAGSHKMWGCSMQYQRKKFPAADDILFNIQIQTA